ncbi:MAG: xanthine dehydrogenase family protein molybdopterin-binding subunit [Actinobacteria bacterium]|nr:xanthine dehydrogenase family protein molybdopterin-binding subunit [Actinomycetota bacterium]
MSTDLSVVGRRLPAYGAVNKATGATKYSVDMCEPGMLVGKLLHSPHAHANIRSIDKSRAQALPGVLAVISWEDIPQKPFNPSVQDWGLHDTSNEINDMYVISEKARFVGDVVGAVAAVDEATAVEALRLIDVEYEVLPAVFDVLDAMRPGAPVVHDSFGSNVSRSFGFAGSRGDVERALGDAPVVVGETFKTSKQFIQALEPLNCLAEFAPTGELTVWMPVQRPLVFRKKIAELFELPEAKVNVICEHAGGFFGEANWSVAPICVALAKQAGRPVKLEYSRLETGMNCASRETYVITGTLGVSAKGELTAVKEDVIVDSGAYFNRSAACTVVHMADFTGLYRCPNVSAKATAVYTNVPMASGFRGYGGPPAFFALEQLMDMAAEKLDLDPVELRLRNVKRLGDFGHAFPLETDTHAAVIRLGAEKIGWEEKRARPKVDGDVRRGVGVAAYYDVSGGQPFERFDRNLEMQLNEDGSVTVIINHPDGGMNLLGTCAQLIAEVLGIDYQDVHFVHGETEGKLWDGGMAANGGLYTVGNAVVRAAHSLKAKILAEASARLGVPMDQLALRNREIRLKAAGSADFVLGTPVLSLRALADDAIYKALDGSRSLAIIEAYHPTANPNPVGAAFADLAVDIGTGVVKVEKLVLVHDIGRAINPATVEGQLQGGISMGLGYGLFEDPAIGPTDGVMRGGDFNTYRLASPLDMPEVEVVLYEDPAPSGPFGGKGVGMCGVHAVAPAIANAIYHAVDVRITELPMTPEKILEALGGRQL